MTITFRDKAPVQALLLSRSEDTLRVMIAGESDSHILQLVNGTWISESCEPVTIEFEWQRKKRQNIPSEADCICPKALADKLIERLQNPEADELVVEEEHDELQAQLLRVFLAENLGPLPSTRNHWVS